VSAVDLEARLGDPALVVLAAGERREDFDRGHVPGAVFIRLGDIAVAGDGSLGAELPPVDVLRDVFEAAGVGDTSQIVVYGSPLAASRLFFTLDYLGHPNVAVLDGGIDAWRAERRPEAPTRAGADRPPRGRFTPRLKTDRLALADWIAASTASGAIALVDARPDDEFTGADRGRDGAHVAGHLPGARQLLWSTLLDDRGIFLEDAILRARFEAAGARTGVPVVAYCRVGIRASLLYFVARHLGYDARLYDGSIVDWGRRGLPVHVGR
jgi:thiosulfate/3-mercaptopyruvate sulfurtransferase